MKTETETETETENKMKLSYHFSLSRMLLWLTTNVCCPRKKRGKLNSNDIQKKNIRKDCDTLYMNGSSVNVIFLSPPLVFF